MRDMHERGGLGQLTDADTLMPAGLTIPPPEDIRAWHEARRQEFAEQDPALHELLREFCKGWRLEDESADVQPMRDAFLDGAAAVRGHMARGGGEEASRAIHPLTIQILMEGIFEGSVVGYDRLADYTDEVRDSVIYRGVEGAENPYESGFVDSVTALGLSEGEAYVYGMGWFLALNAIELDGLVRQHV